MLLASLFALLFNAPISDSLSIEDFKWQKQVLLYFPISHEENDPWSECDLAGLESRDLVCFVFGEKVESSSGQQLDPHQIGGIKSRYQLGAKASCWVLLGKDGRVRHRGEKDLNWDQIFELLDSDP